MTRPANLLRRLVWALVCALWAHGAWAGSHLAQVGDVVIGPEDVARLRASLPFHLRDADDAWVVETLINRELLVLEARDRGLDTTAAVRAELERATTVKLRDRLFEQAVAGRVRASEEELLEAYRQGPNGQRSEVRVAHIAVATREEAAALRARLAAGESFADLARTHSLDTATGARGGEIGLWREGEVAGAVADEAWTLPVDSVSAPILGGDRRFHLVTVLERTILGFEGQREALEKRVVAAKTRQGRAAFIASPLSAYDATVDDAVVRRLRDRGRTAVRRLPGPEPGDGSAVLVRYRDGAVTVAEYLQWLGRIEAPGRRPYPVRPGEIAEAARRYTVFERLYPLEARHRGLQRTDEMRQWQQRKTGDLLIGALRRAAVEPALLTPEAVRQFHRENAAQFERPEYLFVEAALTAGPQEARALAEAVGSEGSLADAAPAHAPADMPENYRVFCLADGEVVGPDWAPPQVAAAALELGHPGAGPAVVPYSRDDATQRLAVVRVVAQEAGRSRPLANPQVRGAVLEALRQGHSEELDRAFEEFVAGLRQAREDVIQYAGPAEGG